MTKYGGDNDFNPRPREEGDCGAKMDKENSKYFNPRPREEGDGLPLGLGREKAISIHALVKRATGDIVPRSKGDFISIHALVKRATCQNTHKVLFKT